MFWLLGLSCFWVAAGLHNFHFSRTDARWNANTETVQTTLRVFTDDLELALRRHHQLGEDVKIWLGEENEWNGANAALHSLLKAHLVMQRGNDTLHWRWVGKEVELDVSFLHLESQRLESHPGSWLVQNTLFFAEFEDQVNEIHLHDALPAGPAAERREMLNVDFPSFQWEPDQDGSSVPHD